MEPAVGSPAVRELIRRGSEELLKGLPDWFDEIEAAAFAASDLQTLGEDPVLRGFMVRDIYELLRHWAAANVARPGEPVAPVVDDGHETARSFVLRGRAAASVDAYRMGQNAAWRRWMGIAFGLTSNLNDLRDMLDITAKSVSVFVDTSIASLTEQLALERELLLQGREAHKLHIVQTLLAGDTVNRPTAESVLGYRLDQIHTATVMWSTDSSPPVAELERVADLVSRHVQARGTLRLVASAGTVWAWHSAVDERRLRTLATVVGSDSGLRVAIGSPAPGLNGFRSSHLEALGTQRMMSRMGTGHAVGIFADVEGVLLLTTAPDRADEFVARTLGPLNHGYPDLAESIRIYLSEQCNVSKAADRLFTHRNTLLRRIKRADELLPRPLADNALNIAMALEIKHWRGRHVPADG